uniref:Thyrotropin-releasing hormone receptor n=1 Tax=Angiostrongylus cantonensis TaxID=6313 RepID=A0A0K0DQL8_ANGCA
MLCNLSEITGALALVNSNKINGPSHHDLGNVFTIVVIALHPTMRTGTNYFLANLALADLLVAVFCILQNMVHIVGFDHGNWTLGELMCYIYIFMLHFIPCLSVGILVCVSMEKYLVFMHPFSTWTEQILRRRVRFIMTLVTWLLSIASNIPYALNIRLYRFSDTAAACDSQCNALSGVPSQMSNGKTIVCRQESLLQVPDDLRAKRRQRDLTETRRKVQYPSPLHNYDRATPAWVVRLLIVLVASFAILTLPHHARQLHTVKTQCLFSFFQTYVFRQKSGSEEIALFSSNLFCVLVLKTAGYLVKWMHSQSADKGLTTGLKLLDVYRDGVGFATMVNPLCSTFTALKKASTELSQERQIWLCTTKEGFLSACSLHRRPLSTYYLHHLL